MKNLNYDNYDIEYELDMVDSLLEDYNKELAACDFDVFLESINLRSFLEEDQQNNNNQQNNQQQNNQQQQNNNQNQQRNNNQQNNQQQNTTQNNNTQQQSANTNTSSNNTSTDNNSSNNTNTSNNTGDNNNNDHNDQNNNQENNGENNGDEKGNAESLKSQLNNVLNKADEFISGKIDGVTKGLNNVVNKLKETDTYKAIDDISLTTLDALRVPAQVVKAGSTAEQVINAVQNWGGGALNGLKDQGKQLLQAAKDGVNSVGSGKEDEGKEKMGICSSIIASINKAFNSIKDTFQKIFSSADSQGKNESTNLYNLDEEIDILLDDVLFDF